MFIFFRPQILQIEYVLTRHPSRLPTREGLLDWDCAEAISVPDMIKALEHIRAEGTFPVSHNQAIPDYDLTAGSDEQKLDRNES